MNLETFISETLKGIIKGINDAGAFASENNAVINPLREHPGNKVHKTVKTKEGTRFTIEHTINFDIAVIASNQKESGISGGIQVLSLAFGGKATDTSHNETVSRIKFEITALLPMGKALLEE